MKAIVVSGPGCLPEVVYVAELNVCPPGSGLTPCTQQAVIDDARRVAVTRKLTSPARRFEVYVLDGEAKVSARYRPLGHAVAPVLSEPPVREKP